MKMRNSRPTRTKNSQKEDDDDDTVWRIRMYTRYSREISTCCWALSALSRGLKEEEEIERDPGHVTQSFTLLWYPILFFFFFFICVCDANNVCRSRLGATRSTCQLSSN